MKKNKILLTAVIGIVVVIIGIITAMAVTGKFGELRKNFESETTTLAETTTTEPQAVTRPKSQRPESIVAAIYNEINENSVQDIAEFDENGFNTVIFDLTPENQTDIISLINEAKTNSLYFGIRADISADSDYAVSFIESNNVDFVILSGLDETLSDYSERMTAICNEIKTIDAATEIGIEPMYCSNAEDCVVSLTDSGTADFVFLVQKYNDDSGFSVFESGQAVWNEKTSPLWLCHNLQSLKSFSTEKASAMIDLIAASADMSLCEGLAFCYYKDISTATGTAADIVMNYVKERDTYLLDKEFKINNYSKTAITVEQSVITFRGTSSPAYDLLCNGKKLNVAKTGDFSVDCNLNVGSNTIKFEHKGKTYTYNVTYKIKLLKSVSPSEDITVPGEMQIEVSAIALKDAALTVVFNGKTYKMTEASAMEGDEDSSPDTESDFTTFTATLETPASKTSVQKLGSYKITAKYKTLSESLTGASVNVSAKEPDPVPPPTTTEPPAQSTTQEPPSESSSDSSNESTSDNTPGTSSSDTSSGQASSDSLEKYSYLKNYGLGTAKICEIIDDYVEIYPGNTTSTVSVPDCSPLLKGTVDYVKSNAEYDGDTYYILSSGYKVPILREERLASGTEGKITHLKIVDNGFIMPKNSIKVISSHATDSKTTIVLDMNRSVVFNAKLLGQEYGLYSNRPVSVSKMTCTALEFTFSDTVSASGDISFMNSVCKSAKWSSDKDNSTVTLTLSLAQSGKFYGFHYEYDDEGRLVITLSHKPSSLSGATIMLDPGHGGIDPGAACANSSASLGSEKDINLSIATKVKELLEAEGATVIMTRSTDKWVCYTDRNNAVRERDPDMFISIHCDSSSTASATGTSAYYYRAYSQPLAKAVHESIVAAYKNEIYKDNTSVKIDRGANFYAFRVARVEECPAILIEYGFVSNTDECEILQTAKNRDILAKATVEGIRNYLSAS